MPLFFAESRLCEKEIDVDTFLLTASGLLLGIQHCFEVRGM
jgi:hypothetical protein